VDRAGVFFQRFGHWKKASPEQKVSTLNDSSTLILVLIHTVKHVYLMSIKFSQFLELPITMILSA